MTISLRHKFTSPKADSGDTTLVRPSNWNDEHDLTAATGKVLGTTTSSTTVTELPIAVDASGNVGIGGTPTHKFVVKPIDTSGSLFLVDGYDSGSGGSNSNIFVSTESYNSDGYGSQYGISYARGTKEFPSSVQNGDVIGYFMWQAYANGASHQHATIEGFVDGAYSGSDVPIGINIKTSNNTVNGITRLRISSTGNILINTTTDAGGARLTAQSLNGASTRAIAAISRTAGDESVGPLWVSKQTTTNTTSQAFAQFVINDGATASGQINANGASQAAFGSYSDARLKENIENIPPQLANIMSLRPVEFDYIDGSGHQIGFVAQEMQQIYPDAVGERTDGMLTVTGWSKTEARLVKALQEACSKIDALEARIAALEAAQ
jgi:hypothetical protein